MKSHRTHDNNIFVYYEYKMKNYRNLGKLAHLNGVGTLDEVFTRITEALAGTPEVG